MPGGNFQGRMTISSTGGVCETPDEEGHRRRGPKDFREGDTGWDAGVTNRLGALITRPVAVRVLQYTQLGKLRCTLVRINKQLKKGTSGVVVRSKFRRKSYLQAACCV